MNHSSNSLPLVLGLAAGLGVVAYFLLIKNDPVQQTQVREPTPNPDNSQSSQQQVGTTTKSNTGYSINPSQNQLTPNPPKRPDLKRGSEGTTDTGHLTTQFQLIENLPTNEQYAARRKLLIEWVTVDPKSALQALEQVPDDHRAGTLSAIAQAWGKVEPEAAAAWALKLPKDDSVRALAASVTGWFQVDRVAAKSYATELEPGPYRTEILRSLAANWAGPPRSAAEWLGTLQDDAGRNQAMSSVFSLWGRTNPSLAEAWVMQSPHGTIRDHATLGLSRGLLTRDPGKALRYAQQIEDTDVKAMQLRSMVNDYARSCISCHRSGKSGCLRGPVTDLPNSLVPAQQKSRVFNIVRRNLNN